MLLTFDKDFGEIAYRTGVQTALLKGAARSRPRVRAAYGRSSNPSAMASRRTPGRFEPTP